MGKSLLFSLALVGVFGLTSGCGFLAGMQKDTAAQIRAQKADDGKAQQNEEYENAHRQHVTQGALEALNQGNYGEAIQQADGVLKEDGQNDYAYSIKGLALALPGQVAEGLTNTQKAYDLNPENVANYYNMAMVYKLGGQLNESKVWFEKVLEKDPKNTWSLYGIATIYADQGEDDQALAWLEKAIAADPSVKAVAAEQDHFARFHGNAKFQALIK